MECHEEGLAGDSLGVVRATSTRRPRSCLYAGVDLSRRRLDVHVLDEDDRTIEGEDVPDGFGELAGEVDPGDLRAALPAYVRCWPAGRHPGRQLSSPKTVRRALGRATRVSCLARCSTPQTLQRDSHLSTTCVGTTARARTRARECLHMERGRRCRDSPRREASSARRSGGRPDHPSGSRLSANAR
jgi:hypothetical protein